MDEFTHLPEEHSSPGEEIYGETLSAATPLEECSLPQEIFSTEEGLIQSDTSSSDYYESRRETRKKKWLLQIASAMLSIVLTADVFGISLLSSSSSSEESTSEQESSEYTSYGLQIIDGCSKVEENESEENIVSLLHLLTAQELRKYYFENSVDPTNDTNTLSLASSVSGENAEENYGVTFHHMNRNLDTGASTTRTGKQIYTTQMRYYNFSTGYGIFINVYYCEDKCTQDDISDIGSHCEVILGKMVPDDPNYLNDFDCEISDATYYSYSQPYYGIAIGDSDYPEGMVYTNYVDFTCLYKSYNNFYDIDL